MAQPFNFGFHDDDIESDHAGEDDMDAEPGEPAKPLTVHDDQGLLEPRVWDLDEMLSSLPSQITYTTHHILNPPHPSITIPRRDIFDIRTQLLAEADLDEPTDPLEHGLASDDLQPRVYEGGFKTWECAVDLAQYVAGLLSDGELVLYGQQVDIIEDSVETCKLYPFSMTDYRLQLGAGTATPTATLLAHILLQTSQIATTSLSPPIRIIVADYNAPVLKLCTIPNLVLTATAATHTPQSWPPGGILELPASAIDIFKASLTHGNVTITGISGAWGPDFLSLLASLSSPPPSSSPSSRSDEPHVSTPMTGVKARLPALTLVLASETIYAPASLRAFASTVLGLLTRCGADGGVRAFVAAKMVYFGVGGGVEEFLGAVGALGGWGRVAWKSADGGGVGRCVLEVGVR